MEILSNSSNKKRQKKPENLSQAQLLSMLPEPEQQKILSRLTPQQLINLRWDWDFWARPDQKSPERFKNGDASIRLCMAGRGWGKTRVGSEWLRERVRSGKARHIALVGRTASDVRDVMVRGPSGLLSCYPEDERPEYEPSKRVITWKCGAVAHTFSSEKPDQLRGPQHDTAWFDELAAAQYAQDCWDQLMFGLRLGDPKCLVTTTPRPIRLIRDLMKRESTVVTRGSTFDNRSNLSSVFIEEIVHKYEGTSLGRQELYAELLDELPGALWSRRIIDAYRLKSPESVPDLRRIVVAVDPAMTSNSDSDETGIIVCGIDDNSHFYVLEDASARMTVDGWARKTIECYRRWNADRIIAEVNQGGDLVEKIIKQSGESNVAYRGIRASRGKYARAEPVAGRYEQGRVHHADTFDELEDQLCTYSQLSKFSPDRLDALVWGITELDSRSRLLVSINPNDGYVKRSWL